MSLNFNSFLEVCHREYNKRIQTAGCRRHIIPPSNDFNSTRGCIGTSNLHLYSSLLYMRFHRIFKCLSRAYFFYPMYTYNNKIYIVLYKSIENTYGFHLNLESPIVYSRFILTLSQCSQNSTIYRCATVPVANTQYLSLDSRCAANLTSTQ